jgi:hypothetical protein
MKKTRLEYYNPEEYQKRLEQCLAAGECILHFKAGDKSQDKAKFVESMKILVKEREVTLPPEIWESFCRHVIELKIDPKPLILNPNRSIPPSIFQKLCDAQFTVLPEATEQKLVEAKRWEMLAMDYVDSSISVSPVYSMNLDNAPHFFKSENPNVKVEVLAKIMNGLYSHSINKQYTSHSEIELSPIIYQILRSKNQYLNADNFNVIDEVLHALNYFRHSDLDREQQNELLNQFALNSIFHSKKTLSHFLSIVKTNDVAFDQNTQAAIVSKLNNTSVEYLDTEYRDEEKFKEFKEKNVDERFRIAFGRYNSVFFEKNRNPDADRATKLELFSMLKSFGKMIKLYEYIGDPVAIDIRSKIIEARDGRNNSLLDLVDPNNPNSVPRLFYDLTYRRKQIQIPLPTVRQALQKLIDLEKIQMLGQGAGTKYRVVGK